VYLERNFDASFIPGYDHAFHIQFILTEQNAKTQQLKGKKRRKKMNPCNEVDDQFF
jgi:hypothetical protein